MSLWLCCNTCGGGARGVSYGGAPSQSCGGAPTHRTLNTTLQKEHQFLVVRQTLDRQTLDTTNPRQTNGGHNKRRT